MLTKSAIDQAKQELAAAVAEQQGVRSDAVTAAKLSTTQRPLFQVKLLKQIAALQKKLGDRAPLLQILSKP
ncbi:hypothetical protein [Weissella cibaria]|uniref:hypothetical protein n=1 Tax=Weissella cibaria TaxID=137591 RepID=UPI001E367D53|nr:hypothetical protein [Weissella cibaria]